MTMTPNQMALSFEEIVLLAVAGKSLPTAAQVHQLLSLALDRPVAVGALHGTMKRLEGKGLLARRRVRVAGNPGPGRVSHVWHITAAGGDELKRAANIRKSLKPKTKPILK